jgi:AcrR family transcriptional regulator
MFTKNNKPAKRGRPPGRTAAGEATRRKLHETAIRLIRERGYEATTLRDVATRAGVSPGLLYRYFPSKRSVVLALYDELSDAFAKEAVAYAGRQMARTLSVCARDEPARAGPASGDLARARSGDGRRRGRGRVSPRALRFHARACRPFFGRL